VFFFNYIFGQVGLYHQNLQQSISSVFSKIDVNSAHVYLFFTISGSLDQNLFQRYFRQETPPDAPPNPEQLWQ